MEHFIFTTKGPSGERVTIEGGTFMHSSKRARQAMGLYFASLVSLVKPYDTVDPNFEITTHSLRPKKNGKM